MGCCGSSESKSKLRAEQAAPPSHGQNAVIRHVGVITPADRPSLPPEFGDLFHDLFSGPGCSIPDSALRAISLDQLDLVLAHVIRRLAGGEVWKVSRFKDGQMSPEVLTDPANAQLYDVSTHVIVPSTAIQQLSLVEAMARTPQPKQPDYFVSHWS